MRKSFKLFIRRWRFSHMATIYQHHTVPHTVHSFALQSNPLEIENVIDSGMSAADCAL
jgi:hypothetical protein